MVSLIWALISGSSPPSAAAAAISASDRAEVVNDRLYRLALLEPEPTVEAVSMRLSAAWASRLALDGAGCTRLTDDIDRSLDSPPVSP